MLHLQRHLDLHLPFSTLNNGKSTIAPRTAYDGTPSAIAGFALTCIFIVAFLPLLGGTIIVSLHLHTRRQRNGTQRRGGRLGLTLVAGELFALLLLVVNGFFYGWLALSP